MKALLLVDIQEGLTKRKNLYNASCFIETVNYAISRYRKLGNLVIFIQHNNKQLIYGESDWEIDKRIDKRNEDITLQKQHGNAFEKTELKSILENENIKEILVCGLVSHGCIKLTCM
ncbi:unnamed protein product, partial [marine sediment metagenome]